MNQFVIDVDNTITPPRQPMTQEFSEFFTFFLNKNEVHLISGSDIGKIKEQVPIHILRNVRSIHACSGNQIWVPEDGELILNRENRWWPGEDLLWEIIELLEESPYPLQLGNHIETRVGCINISTIGRNANKEQRDEYEKWDMEYGERKGIVQYLLSNFSHIDCAIGGQISIDIYEKGNDKSQIIRWLSSRDEFKTWLDDPLIFFGDKCINGNDKTLAKIIISENAGYFHNVKDWKETLGILKEFYDNN